MFSSRNISNAILAILFIFFLTSSVPSAVCQKNYDNWIFGSGAHVSFQDGRAVVMPVYEGSEDYHNSHNMHDYFVAYSDDYGNLLFYCYLVKKNGVLYFEVADFENRVIYNDSFVSAFDFGICNIGDNENKDVHHLFVKKENAKVGSVHELHHLIINCAKGIVSLASHDVYRGLRIDDFVTVSVNDYPCLIVYNDEEGCLKTFEVSDSLMLVSTARDFKMTTTVYRSNLRISADGSFLLFKNGEKYYRTEIGEYGDVAGKVDMGIDSVSCFEFSPSGEYLFCGKYGKTKSEFMVIRYRIVGSIHKASEVADTIVVLRKQMSGDIFNSRSDMIVGPDGNIYLGFSGDGYVSVIESPDAPSNDCKFNYQALYLDGAVCENSFLHVPRYLPSFLYAVECGSASFDYRGIGAKKVSWDFGDGVIAEGRHVVHNFMSFGICNVTMSVLFHNDEMKTVSKFVKIPKQVSLPKIIRE